jgi:hypothetical protein
MDYEYMISKEGVSRRINITSHAYGIFEFNIKTQVLDNEGMIDIEDEYIAYFTADEFISLFGDMVDDFKKENLK